MFPFVPKIISQLNVIVRDIILNSIAASVIIPKPIRYTIYKLAGINTSTYNICPRCFFGGTNVTIGSNSFVNYNVFFDCSADIVIGNNCAIAMGVLFCTSTHKIGDATRRAAEHTGYPIRIGDGCWLGAQVVILPGVTIGNGCIIAAGSVVTKDCQPNSFYAGVPAVLVKNLS